MIRTIIYTLLGIGTVGYLIPMYWDYRLALGDNNIDVAVRLACSFPSMIAALGFISWAGTPELGESKLNVPGMICAGILSSVGLSCALGWIMFPETNLMGTVAIGIVVVYTIVEFSQVFVVNEDR